MSSKAPIQVKFDIKSNTSIYLASLPVIQELLGLMVKQPYADLSEDEIMVLNGSVHSSLKNNITDVPITVYSAKNRKPIHSRPLKNGVNIANLWEQLQISWLRCDFLLRTAMNNPFYEQRKHTDLKALEYPDTLPSTLIVFGTHMDTNPEIWDKFHQCYATLCELGISMMWTYAQTQTAINKQDTSLLVDTILELPAILSFAEDLFKKNFDPSDPTARRLFQNHIITELCILVNKNNGNPTGQWNFYPARDIHEKIRLDDWRVDLKKFSIGL